jgi:hypothetical protein
VDHRHPTADVANSSVPDRTHHTGEPFTNVDQRDPSAEAANAPPPSAGRWTVISPRQSPRARTTDTWSTPGERTDAWSSARAPGASPTVAQRSGGIFPGVNSPQHTLNVHHGTTIQGGTNTDSGTDSQSRGGSSASHGSGGQARSLSASGTPLRPTPGASTRTIQRYHDTSSSSSQQQPPASADLHLIAQQVYRILKQRLLLERERAGLAHG